MSGAVPREPGGFCFGVGGSCDLGDVISTIVFLIVLAVAVVAIAALVVYLLLDHIRDRFPSEVAEIGDGRRESRGNGGMSGSSKGFVRVSRAQKGRRGPDETSDSCGGGEAHRLSSAWRPTRPRLSRAAVERQIQLRVEQGRQDAKNDGTDATRDHETTNWRGQSESLADKKERLRRETNRWLPGYYRRSRDVLE